MQFVQGDCCFPPESQSVLQMTKGGINLKLTASECSVVEIKGVYVFQQWPRKPSGRMDMEASDSHCPWGGMGTRERRLESIY